MAPSGASVPSLGLSNKAVFSGDAVSQDEEKDLLNECPEGYFTPVCLVGEAYKLTYY